ncbi:MAG: hypothetical protein D6781_06870 [Verrucomicrobia bacterium]|nr:MAG: hypothetical protein D6781_06870 [Verrucomicrobiota bacterium]
MSGSWKYALALLALPLATIASWWAPSSSPGGDTDLVALGRRVYIAEGCIHCHSQYLRPGNPADQFPGGPVDPAAALAGRPVLIGNRRQGPDLATVGIRRTAEWHRLHLQNPRRVSPGSLMPAYPHLFEGPDAIRGEALVAYLASLGKGVSSLPSQPSS